MTPLPESHRRILTRAYRDGAVTAAAATRDPIAALYRQGLLTTDRAWDDRAQRPKTIVVITDAGRAAIGRAPRPAA